MRILFASPIPPSMRASGGRDPLDPFTGQLSPTQGPFAMTMHGHYWALYLLAENLRAESCVLEHPSTAQFEAELGKGYDLLGLQVNWNTLPETADMVQRARRLAPDTRIVIGGYAIPQILDPLPADRADAARICEGAHALCREEGVRFMRRLIHDTPVGRPITQLTLPRSGSYLSAVGPAARALSSRPILVSLGCPAGCDFCNTSAFFRRRKIRIAEPEECHSAMRHHVRHDGAARASFELFDEDLYWDPAYSRRLGALLRDDPETAGRVGYFTFGSVRTLSKLDPEELVADGLAAVWIGVESTLEDVLRPSAHLGKRKGKDVADLFTSLLEVGISTVGSLILGFDFHTPENVRRDVDAFVALAPSISQVTPLIPCAGTRLYERMKAAGRLEPGFGWTVPGGFEANPPMAPLHFSWPELAQTIAEANRRLYEENGPSALRQLDTALRGHLRLRGHADPVLAARGRVLGESARAQYPLLVAVIENAPSRRVRQCARETEERWREAFGRPDDTERALGRALAQRIHAFAVDPSARVGGPAPPARWTYYHPGAAPRVVKAAAA
jgi:haloalkane dehalogenase